MNKSNWDYAAEHILKIEGGYVNHANDPGGATNYGVSIRFLKDYAARSDLILSLGDVDRDGDIDINDIKKLPKEKALEIYKQVFWNPFAYWDYPARTALKMFDMGVNMGNAQAHKLIQRACNRFDGIKLKEDGVLGPTTKARILQLAKTEAQFLASIRVVQKAFYDSIILRNPKLAVFRKGWMNRVNSV